MGSGLAHIADRYVGDGPARTRQGDGVTSMEDHAAFRDFPVVCGIARIDR